MGPSGVRARHNAAANFIAPTESLSPRAFDAVTSTVMKGSFHTTHAAGRRWIGAGLPGSVLSTLTTWVWTGSAFVTPSAMAKAAVHSMIPMGRTGTMIELANLTMFLLSDACDYLTGQTIAMDGGQMLAGPGTFAGLTSMTTEDWAEAPERSRAATAASKAQRS